MNTPDVEIQVSGPNATNVGLGEACRSLHMEYGTVTRGGQVTLCLHTAELLKLGKRVIANSCQRLLCTAKAVNGDAGAAVTQLPSPSPGEAFVCAQVAEQHAQAGVGMTAGSVDDLEDLIGAPTAILPDEHMAAGLAEVQGTLRNCGMEVQLPDMSQDADAFSNWYTSC